MYELRLIHAPVPQYSPVLSEEPDWATSGALPPRIAARIFWSLTPPTTVTWIDGCVFSNCAITFFTTVSSGLEK